MVFSIGCSGIDWSTVRLEFVSSCTECPSDTIYDWDSALGLAGREGSNDAALILKLEGR